MKKIPCPDCGEYPVNHASEYFSAFSESALTPLLAPFEMAARKLRPLLTKAFPDRLALPLFRVMAALRLGSVKTAPDNLDSHRNLIVWETAKRQGITLYQFRVMGRHDGINFFVAYSRNRVRAFEGIPKPQRGYSKSLPWMDNKGTLKKKFTAAGIPMAQGKACVSYRQALQTMKAVGSPVITKPNVGSRSRHTTVHITTETQLKEGFQKAKKLSPWVIVEQELQGFLFRVLLVNKKVAAITRREPPHVIGDGKHTVHKLAEEENKNPKRDGPTFHPLRFDNTATQELARHGLSWDSVPQKGQMVTLHSYISRFFGGSTTDFTYRVHPENIALFEHIGAVLDDSLVGVDFIIYDMERSWRDQKLCGVIEVNSLPNIDLHHDILYGENHDIAGMLLDLAFPNS